VGDALGEEFNRFDDAQPASAIRVVCNAYLTNETLLPVLRRCCQRIGCELRRHARAETPEPTAHRGEIVLMDVPAGVHRQLDACRRIKLADAGTRVALLLHQPSRATVTQAFEAGADAILGLPMDDATLSARLRVLLK
jgi:DNA-binding response OmpR family regulator